MTPQEAFVADRLRDALTAAATVQRARPLDLPEAAPRGRKRVTRIWLVPVAAAISVVAIAIGALAIVSHHARTRGSGLTSLTGLPTEAAAPGPPPAYFVVPGDTGGLQVHRTDDDALTDWFWPSSLGKSWVSDVISVAADNRTFFVSADVSHTTSRFFRFTLTGAGKITGFRSAGVPITGSVEDFAASPDGSRIAYTLPDGTGRGETVSIMNLTSGATRTWHNAVTEQTAAREQRVLDMSWLPDGRTLIVDYEWLQRYVHPSGNLAAVALDTASSGGSLQAHSRLVWSQGDNCTACVRDLLAGPDGKSLTALIVQHTSTSYAESVVRMSLATGQPVSILYRASGSPLPVEDQYPAVVSDGTGRYLALFTGWQSSRPLIALPGRTGWVSGGRLVPLRVPEPATSLVFAW